MYVMTDLADRSTSICPKSPKTQDFERNFHGFSYRRHKYFCELLGYIVRVAVAEIKAVAGG